VTIEEPDRHQADHTSRRRTKMKNAKFGDLTVARLEENVAADDVVLTADQMKRLDELTPASGGHHNEAQMEMIER
jgi:hypothetical protein